MRRKSSELLLVSGEKIMGSLFQSNSTSSMSYSFRLSSSSFLFYAAPLLGSGYNCSTGGGVSID